MARMKIARYAVLFDCSYIVKVNFSFYKLSRLEILKSVKLVFFNLSMKTFCFC